MLFSDCGLPLPAGRLAGLRLRPRLSGDYVPLPRALQRAQNLFVPPTADLPDFSSPGLIWITIVSRDIEFRSTKERAPWAEASPFWPFRGGNFFFIPAILLPGADSMSNELPAHLTCSPVRFRAGIGFQLSAAA